MEALGSILPFVAIAVVFWLLLIRPQRRRQLELLATQRGLQVGDEVMLGAGIVGRVAGDSEEFLDLEVSPGVTMKVARAAVVRKVQPEPAEETGAADPDVTDPDLTDPSRDH